MTVVTLADKGGGVSPAAPLQAVARGAILTLWTSPRRMSRGRCRTTRFEPAHFLIKQGAALGEGDPSPGWHLCQGRLVTCGVCMLTASVVWVAYLTALGCIAATTVLAWRQSAKPLVEVTGSLRLFSLGVIANTTAFIALLLMNGHIYLMNKGLLVRADVMRFYGWFMLCSIVGFVGALFGRGRGRIYLLAATVGTTVILYAFLGMSL